LQRAVHERERAGYGVRVFMRWRKPRQGGAVVTKLERAKAARASGAASLVELFDASGKPYTCRASVTFDPDMIGHADRLARAMVTEAQRDGYKFGSSSSALAPGHVADLILGDASDVIWRRP
jgi:hypothetical protein